MYCPKCGAFNKDGGDFCSACGSPLKVAVANAAPHKKKSKMPLIIAIAVVLVVIAIVAVLLLTRDKSTEVYVPELSTFFGADGTPYQTYTYTYNADGTLKQDILREYDSDSTTYTYITNYSYDSDSRTITASTKALIDDTDEILETYRIDFYYNKRGLVTEAIIYDYECPSEHFIAEYVRRVVFEYDIDWNLKSSSYYYAIYDEDLESYVNSYKSDPFAGRLFSYTSDADGSRLKSVECQTYDDGRVSSSYTHSYTYLNDNTIEVSYSQEDGYECELAITYNCQTIENTSEIDMQSFITIIAFY